MCARLAKAETFGALVKNRLGCSGQSVRVVGRNNARVINLPAIGILGFLRGMAWRPMGRKRRAWREHSIVCDTSRLIPNSIRAGNETICRVLKSTKIGASHHLSMH